MSIKSSIQFLIGNLSPMLITRLLYYKTFHKKLDLKNPQTINEKIQWMKFYGDTSQWPLYSDKKRVREYVADQGLSHTLVKLYGSWDRIEDVDWESLPNQFVLKVNNGCGDVLICTDKEKLDIPSISIKYNKLLRVKFGIQTGQLHYKAIEPCIIIEELLDVSKQSVASSSLVDYKIWCFNGKPTYVFVYRNRKGGDADSMVYDLEWNAHPEYLTVSNHFNIMSDSIPRPHCLDEMISIARILSKGNPEMRVDLYEVDGKVYFGELTMTAAAGFMNHFTDDFLLMMGSHIQLN